MKKQFETMGLVNRSLARFALVLVAIASTLAGINQFSPMARAAGAPDTKGTDFWLTFPGNFSHDGTLSLFITGDTNTSGTVNIPGLAFSTPFTVTSGVVTTVVVPTTADLSTSDVVENKGIHVTAMDEVTVYGLNRIQFSTDAYLGLPTDILGTDYIVLGYKNSDIVNATEFAIVGTQNSTIVTITPSVTTDAHLAGVPYNIGLNQGETYQLVNTADAPADLSGTIVSATKPIAVFGGHNCANIPPGAVACDHVVEELMPTTAWGKNFVTMPLATRLNGDTFRFIASTDGTNVSLNGVPLVTLNRGQLHEQIINGPAQITSDQPIMVAQSSNGTSFDGVTSDPFMMLIPPFEQFLAGYTVTTPASGFDINFINVVAPNAAVGSILLDGSAIPAGSYTAIGSSGFSGAQLAVTVGSHTLAGPLPFGAFVYGFADADSYGYPGGMSLAPIAIVTHVALAPKTATNPIGTQHCVTATLTDQNSNPVEGVRVDFTVVGDNTGSGFSTTDANGQTTFCYTGNNVGTDTITASVGTLSDTASKTWTTTTTTTFSGIIGLESASVGARKAVIDSFDSSVGPYGGTNKGGNAILLSNGDIRIGGAKVYGDVLSTQSSITLQSASLVTGNATAGTFINNSGIINGSVVPNSPSPLLIAPPAPECSSFSTGEGITGRGFTYNAATGDLTIKGGKNVTLANGTYCFHNLTISGGSVLLVNGPVVIQHTGQLNVSGGSFANPSFVPANLQISSSYTGGNGVTFSGSSAAYLTVYAPGTNVTLSGGAQLFGSVLGKTLTVSGDSAIHYDTQLTRASAR